LIFKAMTGLTLNSDNPKELIEYHLYYNMSYIWAGNWHNYKLYSESLLEKNLKIGEIWHAIIYLYHYIMTQVSHPKAGTQPRTACSKA